MLITVDEVFDQLAVGFMLLDDVLPEDEWCVLEPWKDAFMNAEARAKEIARERGVDLGTALSMAIPEKGEQVKSLLHRSNERAHRRQETIDEIKRTRRKG